MKYLSFLRVGYSSIVHFFFSLTFPSVFPLRTRLHNSQSFAKNPSIWAHIRTNKRTISPWWMNEISLTCTCTTSPPPPPPPPPTAPHDFRFHFDGDINSFCAIIDLIFAEIVAKMAPQKFCSKSVDCILARFLQCGSTKLQVGAYVVKETGIVWKFESDSMSLVSSQLMERPFFSVSCKKNYPLH